MSARAAITVNRPLGEVERLWEAHGRTPGTKDATVTFTDAPGDRGTEIHVSMETGPPIVGRLTGAAPLSKVKDELRRFKQLVETGEIPRSDAVPEGELAERKFKQRPAQPLEQSEREKAGVA